MTVQVREGDLLGIDSVHFEDFCDSGWARRRPFTLLHFALWPLRRGLEAAEQTRWLFDFNLPRKLCDELAEWPEALVFVANNLDEGISVSDQTCDTKESD